MGNHNSKPSNAGQQGPSFTYRIRGQRLTPRQERDARTGHPIHHEELDMDAELIQAGFHRVAQQMHASGQHIKLVTVGGAVNTLLLRSRNTTHDVDFFNSALTQSQISLISSAAQRANLECGALLGRGWLNNTTTLYLSDQTVAELTRLSELQNEIVFSAPGLTVLAAPWHYAFCTKLERMSNPAKRRAYDLDDVTAYLSRVIARRGGLPVQRRELRYWFEQFRVRVDEDILREVRDEYLHTKGKVGLVL